jgi:hypothetical protein
MVIVLERDLENALGEAARRQGVKPEELALTALRDRFLASGPRLKPQDEWEQRLCEAATDCRVSLSDSAVSSEGLYD